MNWIGERLTATLDVDGHVAASAQACRSTQAPSGAISPTSSASGTNSAGRHQPGSRMAPTQQRFEPDDLAFGVDQRLVIELQLARGQRRPQIELRARGAPNPRVHLRLKEP